MNTIQEDDYRSLLNKRHARGTRMQIFYLSSLVLAFFVLLVLLATIVNQTFGLTLSDVDTPPSELEAMFDGTPLVEMTNDQLAEILLDRRPGLLLPNSHTLLSDMGSPRDMASVPLSEAFPDVDFSEFPADSELLPEDFDPDVTTLRDVPSLNPFLAELLKLNATQAELFNIVDQSVVGLRTIRVWNLSESILDREEIDAFVEEAQLENPNATLEWKSWLAGDLLSGAINREDAAKTGIAPALAGTIWIMVLVIVIAFPLGVCAAIYLEEYATDNWLNRLIETNIRNLAGVPSIIYGLLGLSVFVRTLAPITNGEFLGLATRTDGRTVLSAALTLSLLILPVIIIQTQEALKAVSSSVREGSYGLGATKWQTISRQLLPAALPGIMTGTIIALSRAIGETAPILVVGGSTFLSTNPDGPFASFSALPLLIYNWAEEPKSGFTNVASAAIIVLLLLLLVMNSIAIYIRNRTATGVR